MTSGVSPASAGGAGAARGSGLQNQVFAWAAAAMAAETALFKPLVAGVVVGVGGQIGYEVDDVALHTDGGNFAVFQSKANLKLSATTTQPLAEAVEQMVKQYLHGRFPVTDGTSRPVDPDRDALVICTDPAAPTTMRNDLHRAVSRTSSQPPGTAFGSELSKPQCKALHVLLDHVRRIWNAEEGTQPSDEQVRRFLRTLRIAVFDLDLGGSDQAAASAHLRNAVSPADRAEAAWAILEAAAQTRAENREWLDRAAVAVELDRSSIRLVPARRFANDIDTLQDLSVTNLATLTADASLPVAGGLNIDRDITARFTTQAATANALVVGDAGSGKSSVVAAFATYRATTQDVVVLRAEDIAGTNRASLTAPLSTVLREWYGPPALLVVDGVDALRGHEDRNLLSRVVADLAGTRWQVVASVRTFDARHNLALRAQFAGPPVSAEPADVDTTLGNVRHLRVGDLTDDELTASIRPPLRLASMLGQAPPDLKGLLRNPFNLSLAADLANTITADQENEMLGIRTRVALLGAYWRWRVQQDDPTARAVLLTRLCRAMVTARNLRVREAEPVVTAADNAAVQALLSANVLVEESSGIVAAPRWLVYAHNVLFDYATAVYVLFDDTPAGVVANLDGDPSLTLVGRPSLELLVDLYWEHRHDGMFWPMLLHVAASRHLLASLTFAARLVNAVHDPDDLAPLAPTPGRTDQPGVPLPEQSVVIQLVGAFRGEAVLTDTTRALAPMARLALYLAENATASPNDRALATDVLRALEHRAPLSGGGPGRGDRAETIAVLLDACRSDPAASENVAEAVARLAPAAMAYPTVRDAVSRLLDDQAALEQWGGTVLTWLADYVAPLAHLGERDLARRLATTILGYAETRDEQVPFVPGALLSMTESRRQKAERATDRLAQAFTEIAAVDVELAAHVYCAVAERFVADNHLTSWPLGLDRTGALLQYGSMSTGGRAVAKLPAAMAAALTSAEPAAAAAAVTVLTERLNNGAAWVSLIAAAADDPVPLGRVLLPAFASGALLAFPLTHPAAAGMLAAVAHAGHRPASEIEYAVENAFTLVDATGSDPSVKDRLLGCLHPADVTNAALAARLDEVGPQPTPPPVTPLPPAVGEVRPWSVVDGMLERGVQLTPEAEHAARDLYRETMAARNGVDRRPSEQQLLPQAYSAAAAVFDGTTVNGELTQLLLEAASILAHDKELAPGSDLGEKVFTQLADAAISTSAGQLLRSTTGAWSPGTRDTGTAGLAALYRRPAWRDSSHSAHIRDTLHAALADDNPIVRRHAIEVVDLLYADEDPPTRCAAIETLLAAETVPTTRALLLQHLYRDADLAPDIVDDLLGRVLHTAPAPTTDDGRDLRHVTVELLTYLAVVHHTPIATDTLTVWCTDPVTHAKDTKSFLHCARPHLRSADTQVRDTTFQFVGAAAAAAADTWRASRAAITAGQRPTADLAAHQNAAAEIAHHVSQQLLFASGAFEPDNNPPPSDLRGFADRTYPVLAHCAAVTVPQCVHVCVETMVFLAHLDEPRALSAIAAAVPHDPRYAGDSLAGGVVLPYLQRLLTEQRQLVLHDQAGSTAFRHLLEVFASAGNNEALTMAFTFADVFR